MPRYPAIILSALPLCLVALPAHAQTATPNDTEIGDTKSSDVTTREIRSKNLAEDSVAIAETESLALSVAKAAPTNADEDSSLDVSAGDTLTYKITATNTGTANLTNVVVTDSLITPTGGTTPCALVPPGGTCTLIGTYVVQASDLGTTIHNVGTGDSDRTDPVEDSEDVPVPTPSLSIDKPAPANADEDGSLDVSAGDTLTYTITATNTGTANLTNVVVTDALIVRTGGTTPCALVPSGGTCTLIGTYVVQASDLGTSIHNVGNVDSVQTQKRRLRTNSPSAPSALSSLQVGW